MLAHLKLSMGSLQDTVLQGSACFFSEVGYSRSRCTESLLGCRKQQGLGVAKKNLKGKKQSSVLNRGLHEKRKKGKKVPRAWFHGE